MGGMTRPVAGFATAYRVRLDDRRRPTLPPALLAEAGIDAEPHELVAHVEGPGRVVLEDPAALLEALQEAVAAGKKAQHLTRPLADQLISERAADSSLGTAGTDR